MSAHTLVPLTPRIAKDGSGTVGVVDSQGCVVAEFYNEIRCAGEGVDAEALANARLFAGASGLLAACRSAIVMLKGREHDGFLRDAIAKATGTAS